MSGTIEEIKIYFVKGDAGTVLTEARFIENLGLEGDFHAKGGDRQISLLLAESRGLSGESQEEQKGLCFSRFKGNINIRGLPPDAIKSGALLKSGEVTLEITGETKHCHEECALYEAGKHCKLAGLNLFAKVIKGGIVRVGDSIELSR